MADSSGSATSWTPPPKPARGRRPDLAHDAFGARHARAGSAEGNARRRREKMVENEHLDQGQRLGAMKLRADRELAEPLGAQVAREMQVLPDRGLDLGAERRVEVARYEQVHLVVVLVEPDPVPPAPAVDHRAQVGM